MGVYIDFRDWWIGYFRGEAHHYVCVLPCLVIRWPRRRRRVPDAAPRSAFPVPALPTVLIAGAVGERCSVKGGCSESVRLLVVWPDGSQHRSCFGHGSWLACRGLYEAGVDLFGSIVGERCSCGATENECAWTDGGTAKVCCLRCIHVPAAGVSGG